MVPVDTNTKAAPEIALLVSGGVGNNPGILMYSHIHPGSSIISIHPENRDG
jgi:hypothetical protein